jgi:hypothetical protein
MLVVVVYLSIEAAGKFQWGQVKKVPKCQDFTPTEVRKGTSALSTAEVAMAPPPYKRTIDDVAPFHSRLCCKGGRLED